MKRLNDKLYKYVILFSCLVALGNIIINCLTSFPFLYNYKWISLILFSLIFNYLDKNEKRNKETLRYISFLIVIFFFMPISFFNSNGNHHNLLAYIFIVLICLTYLFKGLKRSSLTFFLISIYIILHAIEYYNPELFIISHEESHDLSKIFQMPIMFLFTYFILITFSKAYEETNYELYKLANFDTLTGLYNRRYFNEKLEGIKDNKEINLVLFDLDNFKEINDNYGHLEGDNVLKYFALLVRKNFDNDENILGRWGGDEFVLTSSVEEKELMLKLLRVKEKFSKMDEKYKLGLNVSFGFVKLSDFNELSQAFARADQYLYKNKVEGRKELERRKIEFKYDKNK